MQDKVYTINQLNSMTVHDLRVVLSKLGGAPGQSKRSELIAQIRGIQSGKIKPSRSNRGRKPKFKQTQKMFNIDDQSSIPISISTNIFNGFTEGFQNGDAVDKQSFSTPNPDVGKGYDDISPNELFANLLGVTRQNGFVLQTSFEDVSVPNKIYFRDSGVEEVKTVVAHGILEILPDGYGFLRNFDSRNRFPDFYVDRQHIKNKNLKTGDFVVGFATNKFDKNCLNVNEIVKVNGVMVDGFSNYRGTAFEAKTAIYPSKKLNLLHKNDNTMRFLDFTCPIGFGQRGLIVAPPKTGKTTILKKLAKAIEVNHPYVHLMVLLIDERPEEVTDFDSSLKSGEVFASTFDQSPEKHIKLAELQLERAKRLVEIGKDVIILVDSITKLARAYNNSLPSSGKLLSGGIDPRALVYPKQFFGSARNCEEGGSLTIIATALVETGSKLDDVIFEEFKGTGNMEIVLSRELADKREFPAIDLIKSGTRNEHLLLDDQTLDCLYKVRNYYINNQNSHRALIDAISRPYEDLNYIQSVKDLIG